MKKISTAGTKQFRNFSAHKLTIGLDLGDRSSWYCVLDEAGEILLEEECLRTKPAALRQGALIPQANLCSTCIAKFAVGCLRTIHSRLRETYRWNGLRIKDCLLKILIPSDESGPRAPSTLYARRVAPSY